jgi:allantoinase
MSSPDYGLLIKNVRVVRPHGNVVHEADIAIVDPAKTWQIAAAGSPSAQGYTPFEGLELSARVDATFLRGSKIFEDGQVLGKPRGKYLHRPTA